MSLLLIAGICHGQTVAVAGPTAVEQGTDTVYTCTLTGGDPSSSAFVWRDESVTPALIIFINGNRLGTIDQNPKYANFDASVNGATSTLTITNTAIEDEGRYLCDVGTVTDDKSLSVEVAHTYSMAVPNPLVEGTVYNATCDALNGRPDVIFTWELGDNTSPCNNRDEQTLTAPVNLTSKRSVCTLQPDRTNNGEELKCIINGHQVPSLNGQQSSTLNIQYAPVRNGIMTVDFQVQDQDPKLLITCNIADNDQPNPRITHYYIIANYSIVIHQSTTEDNNVLIAEPTSVTDFRCVAGNYLGNTTAIATYDLTKSFTTGATTLGIRSEEPPVSYTCLSSGASAGIAILAILLAASITINIIQFLMWRRRTKRADKREPQKVTSSFERSGSNEAKNDDLTYEMMASGDRAYTALKFSSSLSTTIDPENVSFFTRLGSIGRGDFGAVWKGEIRSNHGLAAVAIRQIPDNVSKSTNVLQSVKILCGLSDHMNVVKCVGFCLEQRSIIYEFISGGTLLTHLQTTGVQSQPTYGNLKPNRVRVDEESLLNFAWQIAKGMQFLSSKKIIHGTLCAHNVLLGDKKQCKLSDYGLASSVFNHKGKPTRWSSPETTVTGVQSTEGDIWSFGIVLWEIVTLGARPYPNMTFDTVQKEISNGYTMPRPRHCGEELYTIMSRCWITESRRISFNEILKNLEKILEKTHHYLSLNDLDKDLYASTLEV